MKAPDRYDPRARSVGGPWKMVKCKDGPYVDFEQHQEIVAALAAENERLITGLNDQGRAMLYLSAENERLRKAGDAMAGVIGLPLNKTQTDAHIAAWNAAKEGRDAK